LDSDWTTGFWYRHLPVKHESPTFRRNLNAFSPSLSSHSETFCCVQIALINTVPFNYKLDIKVLLIPYFLIISKWNVQKMQFTENGMCNNLECVKNRMCWIWNVQKWNLLKMECSESVGFFFKKWSVQKMECATEDGRSTSVFSLYWQNSQGRMVDFPAFIASNFFDLWNHHIPEMKWNNLWPILTY
jgi:hypothetical protein